MLALKVEKFPILAFTVFVVIVEGRFQVEADKAEKLPDEKLPAEAFIVFTVIVDGRFQVLALSVEKLPVGAFTVVAVSVPVLTLTGLNVLTYKRLIYASDV